MNYILSFLFGFIFLANVDGQPQPSPEEAFQNHFFEGLKQNGIENYDLAIDAFQKCLSLSKQDEVVYYHLGKNYLLLKNYDAAENYLKKAVNLNPNQVWYLDELYEVYHQQEDIDKAIETLLQLQKFHPDYQQDLATLYIKTNQYQKALFILDQLDEDCGTSVVRIAMREKIFQLTGNTSKGIDFVKNQIKNNPQNKKLYLKLIYQLTEAGKTNEAFEWCKKMQQRFPNSKKVHVALYKFYLSENNIDAAVNSLKTVLTSAEIEPATKTKLLSDFVKFTNKNPQYQTQLSQIVEVADTKKDAKGYLNLGQFYFKQGKLNKAEAQFETGWKKEPENFKLLKALLTVKLALKKFNFVLKESAKALEIYPSQAILYLQNAKAQNGLNQPKNAIEILELGLDFVIENPKMGRDFYLQLSKAHNTLNNAKKAKFFEQKAQQLQTN